MTDYMQLKADKAAVHADAREMAQKLKEPSVGDLIQEKVRLERRVAEVMVLCRNQHPAFFNGKLTSNQCGCMECALKRQILNLLTP